MYTKRVEIIQSIFNNEKYKNIMGNGKNAVEKGFIYETIVILLIIVKQLISNYEAISDSKLSAKNMIFVKIKSIRELFNKALQDGNNMSDISVKFKDKGWTPFSIKYKDTKGNSDLVDCNVCMESYFNKTNEKYSLGYIVKNKSILTNHHDSGRPEALVINKVIEDNHLFDESDVENAYKNFQNIINNMNFTTVNDIIEWIDSNYLNNPLIHLKVKFHQQLALTQFMFNLDDPTMLKHRLSHKPRSGKTITILLIAKYLLDHGHKRILIMTSIPDTIDSFMNELNKYYEFKNINYKEQTEFMDIDDTFYGIAFCSVQYLKSLYEKKKDNLLMFDCNIFDECHFHSSNKNTLDKIINIHGDKKIMQIFASGTSGKTEWFYDIPSKCIYKWSVEDECMMKKCSKQLLQ